MPKRIEYSFGDTVGDKGCTFIKTYRLLETIMENLYEWVFSVVLNVEKVLNQAFHW